MSRWVFSDLHGNYTLWRKILEYIQPGDILHCLGDNIDRGPDGYKICEEQKEMNNIILLRGNHEDLASLAIPDCLTNQFYTINVRNWFMNGGDVTWDSIKNLPTDTILDFAEWCGHLDISYGILNNKNQLIYLDHAGFTLGMEEYAEPLWDRHHFQDSWPTDSMYNSKAEWDRASNSYIIHGHTPVQYLYRKLHIKNPFEELCWEAVDENVVKPTIITYCDGHKIDIDLGTFASQRVALFNLDTFEVVYLDAET